METGSPHAKAIFDLLGAHRELSAVEWEEFLHEIVAASVWMACGAFAGGMVWLALNVTLVVAFGATPLTALGAVIALNGALLVACSLRARALLRRPFFVLTRRETERDLQSVLGALS